MKICIIEHCWECPHCSYSEESPSYKGGCMNDKSKPSSFIKNVCFIPKWCPLEDKD